MASSSLVFGGLSLWHARQNSDGLVGSAGIDVHFPSVLQHLFEWHRLAFIRFIVFFQEIDPRTYAWLMTTLCMLVLLAYSTNPTDSSFRSYLTELSLHRHLHQLRQENTTPLDSSTEEQLEGLARTVSERESSPHILTFANRISVSLRTPRYERNDYGIFSTVTVPCTPLLQADSSHRQPTSPLISTRYVGLFGKWWVFGLVKTQKTKTQRDGKVNGKTQDLWGVLRMRAGEADEGGEANDNIAGNADIEKRIAPIGVSPIKAVGSTQGLENVPYSGGKPPGRRKKQAHKARPSHLLAEGEIAATQHRSEENSSILNSSNASRQIELLEKSNEVEQPSPPTSAPVPGLEATANADLQLQLEQVRLTSESSKKLLQAQLEELRSRKRDEDAARLDVKGRVKTLDESKRQAEGTKRDLEKRLKAANGLRESLENRIKGKVQEMKDMKAREGAQIVKIRLSGERKTLKITEMKSEIQTKEEESHGAEAELEQLKVKLETVHQRLLEEEANLEAARELAAERDAAAMAHRGFNAHAGPLYHNMYPLLSGPGDFSQHSISDMSMENMPRHPDWTTHYNSYGAIPAHQMAMTSGGNRGSSDETFDPTIAPLHSDPPHSSFAPFAYGDHQPAFHLQDIHPPSTEHLLGEGANVPPSPFTSDLLPSNLFLNADDDEKHIGVLPGTRSEQVEAALNRFGLDTSDTSDAGGSGDDTADERENGKDDDEEAEKELSRSGTFRTAARTWWNARGRNASKDRSSSGALPSSDNRPSPAVSSSEAPNMDQEASKRRSLSIFPRLSLNPGAKSFRGSSKKVVDENSFAEYGDDAMQSSAWNNSTGQLPTGQDFESMKRAFQTSNLGAVEHDDDEGRKSWSAFDTWQQMHNNSAPVSAVNRPSFGSHAFNGAMYHTQRASSESLQPIRRLPGSSTPSQGVNWLDDVLLPLQKCQSIDDTNSSLSSSLPRNGQRVGKPSRFAFWSKDSNGAAPSSSSPAQELEIGDEVVVTQQIPKAETALPPSLAPSKRTSFRWSRRSESSSMDVQAVSDHIKE